MWLVDHFESYRLDIGTSWQKMVQNLFCGRMMSLTFWTDLLPASFILEPFPRSAVLRRHVDDVICVFHRLPRFVGSSLPYGLLSKKRLRAWTQILNQLGGLAFGFRVHMWNRLRDGNCRATDSSFLVAQIPEEDSREIARHDNHHGNCSCGSHDRPCGTHGNLDCNVDLVTQPHRLSSPMGFSETKLNPLPFSLRVVETNAPI